jgi:predicted Zn-dependent peptidase
MSISAVLPRPLPSSPPAIQQTTLDNGLRILSEHMGHVRSVSVGIWVPSGSRREKGAERGIAHFLEHMVFKGTPTRNAEMIAREMDSLGGYLDAYTSRELVSFSAKVLDEHLPRALDVLCDMVLHPKLDPEELEREKGVILEEFKMEADNPEYIAHELFCGSFWRGHGVGQSIIGTKKTIQAYTPELVRDYHSRVYTPSNLVITAAGNVDHDALVALLSRYFGSLPAGKALKADRLPKPNAEIVLKQKRTQQAHVWMAFPGIAVADPRRYTAYMLSSLLGGGMSSRLFQNIRERQGLAYSVSSELMNYCDAGCLAIYAGLSTENIPKALASVINELRDLRQNLIPEEEYKRTADHMKGSLMLSLESTSSRMANLARQELYYDRRYSMEEMIAGIDAVRREDLRALANEFFQPEALSLTVLGKLDGMKIERADLVW